jgi:hypothetical protein
MNIVQILTTKYPGTEWTLTGEDYAGLTWLSETPKPTEAELVALWPTVQFEVAHEQVELARARAYRESSDPLFFEWQRGDATEAEWLSAVDAVKTAHPYPVA